MKIGIVLGSTRPGRLGTEVAEWVAKQATLRETATYEIVDVAEYDLDLLDDPVVPGAANREYASDKTRRWSATVDELDGFVFVTPEYNHGTPPSLMNALDYLVQEWAYKPVGFVSYGGVSGGLRGVQMTKQVVVALKMVPLFESVTIPSFTKFIDPDTGVFRPEEVQAKSAVTMLDELLRWGNALRVLRSPDSPAA